MSSSIRRAAPKKALTWSAGAVVAFAVAVLAAAGTSSATTPTAVPASGSVSASVSVVPGPHNAADVTFAQQMILHHRQAVAMAELAASRTHSRKVKALAAKIKADQGPQISRMSAWLRAWGQPVPAPTASGMPGTHHPSCSPSPGMMSGMPGMHHAIPGMMSSGEMAKMMAVSGPAFDRLFLTMMIRHHQGAVQMAKTERLQGEYGPARAMAQSIIASQTAQIAQMRTLLRRG
jgi:uncharacterized protein (DUF305 family)